MEIGRKSRYSLSPFLILLLALVLSAALILSCTKDSSMEPNRDGAQRPPGYLYFLTENPAKIYRYHILNDVLEVLVDGNIGGQCFAVSQNGEVLTYLSQDSLIAVMDFPSNSTNFYPAPHEPMEIITISSDGNRIAYEASSSGGSVITFFLVNSQTFMDFTPAPEDSSRFPLFSRFGATLMAWMQGDGLYFSYLNQNPPIKLTTELSKPSDFSPGNQYLATDEKIFSLSTTNPLPITLNGKSQFLTETEILFYDKTSHQVYQSTLSGTQQKVLIGPFSREFPFTTESSKRYVAYFSNQPSNNRLFILNLSLNRIEIEEDFPFSGSSTVACLFWPDVPLSGNKQQSINKSGG